MSEIKGGMKKFKVKKRKGLCKIEFSTTYSIQHKMHISITHSTAQRAHIAQHTHITHRTAHSTQIPRITHKNKEFVPRGHFTVEGAVVRRLQKQRETKRNQRQGKVTQKQSKGEIVLHVVLGRTKGENKDGKKEG